MYRQVAAAALLAIACCGPSPAQVGPFPKSAMDACLRITFDAKVAAPVVGVWYSETVDPAGSGAVAQTYSQFSADGQFAYQDRTCGSFTCSQNQGHGVYAINATADGGYYVAQLFNDLKRTNWCQGITVKVLDKNTLQLMDGTLMRRVQN